MKIYISGPMSGKRQMDVQDAFLEAEKVIREAGHTPMNPLDNGMPEGSSYEEHMLADFKMLFDSDAILLLFGWRGSRGCRMESAIATNMGKVVFTNLASVKALKN